MKIRSFLKFVEIQTKAASAIPFLSGTILALYRYQRFDPISFLLMLVSLLSFDMTTTAVNNYIDFKRARKKSGYGYEMHNAIVRDNIREPAAVAVILVLASIAVISGFMLYLHTDFIVLLLGILSFVTGILYSAGPVPISRTPAGEVFSGFFMGFLIPFLSFYIHVQDKGILAINFKSPLLYININIIELLSVFVYSVPAVAGIANIMLANNICDMEDDLENNRLTFPLYIGKENALIVFRALYYISYTAVILAMVFGIIPLTGLLFMLTFIPVHKNVGLFLMKQTKKVTFGLSVKNFAIMNISLIAVMLVGLGISLIF